MEKKNLRRINFGFTRIEYNFELGCQPRTDQLSSGLNLVLEIRLQDYMQGWNRFKAITEMI